MWHASAASLYMGEADKQKLQRLAFEALAGVGDASLGQWEEWSGYAYHIRRRLSAAEQQQIGDVVDVRGTPEQDRRAGKVQKFLPLKMRGYKE